MAGKKGRSGRKPDNDRIRLVAGLRTDAETEARFNAFRDAQPVWPTATAVYNAALKHFLTAHGF